MQVKKLLAYMGAGLTLGFMAWYSGLVLATLIVFASLVNQTQEFLGPDWNVSLLPVIFCLGFMSYAFHLRSIPKLRKVSVALMIGFLLAKLLLANAPGLGELVSIERQKLAAAEQIRIALTATNERIASQEAASLTKIKALEAASVDGIARTRDSVLAKADTEAKRRLAEAKAKARASELAGNVQVANASGWEPTPVGTWTRIENWRRIHKGLSRAKVRVILGEPDRITGNGPCETWNYPHGSLDFCSFSNDGVHSWNEPDKQYLSVTTNDSPSRIRSSGQIYRVKRGDSLSRLASQYGTSPEAIIALNRLYPSHHLRTGEALDIPLPN